MSSVTIKVISTPDNVVKVEDRRVKVASVGTQGPTGPHMIDGAHDVDLASRQDGSVMVFSDTTEKWESTTELRNIKINCGSF